MTFWDTNDFSYYLANTFGVVLDGSSLNMSESFVKLNHAMNVARAFDNDQPELKLTAYLHDVLEDTNKTEGDLLNDLVILWPEQSADFLQTIIANVVILTRSSDVSYAQYIDRVRQYTVPRLVKLSDMATNLSRIIELPAARRDSLASRYGRHLPSLVSNPMTEQEKNILLRTNPTAWALIARINAVSAAAVGIY